MSSDLAEILVLQRSGLFDGAWFIERNPDLMREDADPLRHFYRWGWRENRWPNAYFEPSWYLDHNQDVRSSGVNPLLHYVREGERQGRQPVQFFDPAAYRARFEVPDDMLALAHFLQHRHEGRVSPLPEFDAEYYLDRYPDVRAAGMDPFEHYMVQGAGEDREPFAGFDAACYRATHLRNDPAVNPVLHYRAYRGRAATGPDVASEVRRTTRPGPLFESPVPLPSGTRRRATVLAFYLPQFHPVPENDAFWGAGFTEWTNLHRALPRFVGHYQPRIPRDLGHYRLHGTETLRRQAAMARAAGVHGFVFYFYWFNRRRVLEGPLEALLADRSVDLPFCLMWANENWTRRWDGSDDDVLLTQDNRPEDEAALVEEFARHFADPRYIRLAGRPVLMVYRAGLLSPGTVSQWRRRFKALGEDPVFVMAQSFDDRDPRQAGMDAAVEFPPHKHSNGLPLLNGGLTLLDGSMTARVHAYDDLAMASDLSPQPYPLIRTAVPGWDNDPRRQGAGMVLHGATPSAYQAWVERLVEAARQQPVLGEALVCINAWNEWGEGAYLEPDVHFGAAFLNATARAVGATGRPACRLLLVGHDAFPAGAQTLLLSLGRALRHGAGVEVAFALLKGGALLPDYEAVGPVSVASDPDALASLAGHGFVAALVNSAAAAGAVGPLTAAGLDCVLLVHELPRLLRERGLVGPLAEAVAAAKAVLFPAPFVRDRVADLLPLDPAKVHVAPQGLYRPVLATDRAARRRQLGLPPTTMLAIGIGYGDLRKGFDLFLQAWRVAQTFDPPMHLLWVGDLDPQVQAYLGAEIAAAMAQGTFHHLPYAPGGADWLVAADVLLLASREDPFPSVVLEAMSAGVPTAAFEGSGGVPDLLRDRRAGVSVPLGDAAALARAGQELALAARSADRRRLAEWARAEFDFGRYAGQVLRIACPDVLDVSVVVPNFEYARYLPERLRSIVAQTHPVAEFVVLDDASGDGSEAVVREITAETGRTIGWIGAERNSGSVFAQWRKAAAVARGEWVWIAEADDVAEPEFVAALAKAMRAVPDAVMAFSDSSAIDVAGRVLWPDHQAYYAEAGASLLQSDGVFEASDVLAACLAAQNLVLNVSAVLFRRSALLAALDRCGPALAEYRMAGDWRLYAELLSGGGRVAYVAAPLNAHRRHDESVTSALPPAQHIKEVQRMHRHMRAVLGSSRAVREGQQRALASVRRAMRGRTQGSARRST